MTIAEQYKAELAERTDEQETVSPLWATEKFNNVNLLEDEDWDLVLFFLEDGSVYDYRLDEAFTKDEWNAL